MTESRRVEKLRQYHPTENFDCGREELNRYLHRFAWQNQQAVAAQTYVGFAGDAVIGYYTLAVGYVSREEVPERPTKGLARHPVPVMLLARLAVDRRWQGQDAGNALMKDAMLRTLQAADIAGIRAFAVHAKDEDARRFYLKFDFIPSPSDPIHLLFWSKMSEELSVRLRKPVSRPLSRLTRAATRSYFVGLNFTTIQEDLVGDFQDAKSILFYQA
ncbi:MAG: GNAT family N-acetyltransferase [Acidobacteria bacterium]|nr:GNAT family N-acetyltransferase [Acidobacteriota bacterium]